MPARNPATIPRWCAAVSVGTRRSGWLGLPTQSTSRGATSSIPAAPRRWPRGTKEVPGSQSMLRRTERGGTADNIPRQWAGTKPDTSGSTPLAHPGSRHLSTRPQSWTVGNAVLSSGNPPQHGPRLRSRERLMLSFLSGCSVSSRCRAELVAVVGTTHHWSRSSVTP